MAASNVPVLLLKTRSTSSDNYEAHLSLVRDDAYKFSPHFIAVLKHKLDPNPICEVIRPHGSWQQFGGLIVTSQRAVEAIDQACETLAAESEGRLPTLDDEVKPLYTVGPATSRALQTVANRYFGLRARGWPSDDRLNDRHDLPAHPVLGAETGNGEALANYILETYQPSGTEPRKPRKPLLFLVGEQRRDVIPKKLMSPDLPVEQRIGVVEQVVYYTTVDDDFKENFCGMLEATATDPIVCVVVFSPAGCKAMLDVLGWTRANGWKESRYQSPITGQRRVFVVTIGPTTQDYLKKEFGFEADVCARKPSPEGMSEAINGFLLGNSHLDRAW